MIRYSDSDSPLISCPLAGGPGSLTESVSQVELSFRDRRVLSTSAGVLQESPVLSDLCNLLREPYVIHLDNDEHDAWKLLLELLHGNLPLLLSLDRARLLLPLLDKYDFTDRLLEAQLSLSSNCFLQGNLSIEELQGWIELLSHPNCLDREILKACTNQLVVQLQQLLVSQEAEPVLADLIWGYAGGFGATITVFVAAGLAGLAGVAALNGLSAAIAAMVAAKEASLAAAVTVNSARIELDSCLWSMDFSCRMFAWIHDCCRQDRSVVRAAVKVASAASAHLSIVTKGVCFFEMGSYVVIAGLHCIQLPVVALLSIIAMFIILIAIKALSAVIALSAIIALSLFCADEMQQCFSRKNKSEAMEATKVQIQAAMAKLLEINS